MKTMNQKRQAREVEVELELVMLVSVDLIITSRALCARMLRGLGDKLPFERHDIAHGASPYRNNRRFQHRR